MLVVFSLSVSAFFSYPFLLNTYPENSIRLVLPPNVCTPPSCPAAIKVGGQRSMELGQYNRKMSGSTSN
jgi:hypothetical protein